MARVFVGAGADGLGVLDLYAEQFGAVVDDEVVAVAVSPGLAEEVSELAGAEQEGGLGALSDALGVFEVGAAAGVLGIVSSVGFFNLLLVAILALFSAAAVLVTVALVASIFVWHGVTPSSFLCLGVRLVRNVGGNKNGGAGAPPFVAEMNSHCYFTPCVKGWLAEGARSG